MLIETFTPEHPYWQTYVGHIHASGMRHQALHNEQAKPAMTYLGAWLEEKIIGHLSLQYQILATPSSAWSNKTTITDNMNHSLYEMFVQTFYVEERYRRQGYGRALQLAAIEKCRALGCYQLRSWSALDKTANYALKISMGFAIQPAIAPSLDGREVSGVYFIMKV